LLTPCARNRAELSDYEHHEAGDPVDGIYPALNLAGVGVYAEPVEQMGSAPNLSARDGAGLI